MKIQPEQLKIFANHTYDKGLVSRLCKELITAQSEIIHIKINRKPEEVFVFSNNIHRWPPADTWKDQYH